MLTTNTTPQFIPIRERVFGAPGPLARGLNHNPFMTNVVLNWGMYPGVLYNACHRFGVDRVAEEIRCISKLTWVDNKGAYLREAFSRWGREAEARHAVVETPPAPTPPPPQPAVVSKGPENPFKRALQAKPPGISLTTPHPPWHYDSAGVGFSIAALAVPAPITGPPDAVFAGNRWGFSNST